MKTVLLLLATVIALAAQTRSLEEVAPFSDECADCLEGIDACGAAPALGLSMVA